MMNAEILLALVGMTGAFLCAFAAFIWWLSSKFYELKMQINNLHNQNVERFARIENRLNHLERKRGL